MMKERRGDGGSLGRLVGYEIVVSGRVGPDWEEWAGQPVRVTVTEAADATETGTTLLSGRFDQAALQGMLHRIYSVGLAVVSVRVAASEKQED